MSNTGETEVSDDRDKDQQEAECMKKYKHKFSWIWKRDPKTQVAEMTDEVSCINCGEVQVRVRQK